MRKILFFFLLISSFGFAQTTQNISMGPAYQNKLFYSFENGVVGTMRNDNWDIAIATNTITTASISINGGFGAQLFQYTAGDTSAWATLDTAGLASRQNFIECYDSESSYEPSAFEFKATGHPNYGWGIYNSVTHNVNGIALFVIKTTAGDYKKIWIMNQQSMGNTLTFKVANLDGSNEYERTVNKSVGSKNYVYFNLSTQTLIDDEPSNQSYDIVFTKYVSSLAPGVYYPVTGVLLNRTILAAENRGMPVDDANYLTANYTDDISTIGSDWKNFNMTTFQWELEDSLSFFVQDLVGNTWQIWFTDFGGTSTGNIEFQQRNVSTVSVEEVHASEGFQFYPNPAENFIQINTSINSSNTQVVLRDLTGKTIVTQLLNETNQQFDVSQLSSGLYLISVQSANQVFTQKLTIK